MTHFALLDDNNVVVTVVRGRQEDDGREAELSARTSQTYRQTSYNTRGGQHALGGAPFRKNYAGPGYLYDEQRDAFIPPQPFPSWLLDEDTCLWQPPIPYPGGEHIWNETNGMWEPIDG